MDGEAHEQIIPHNGRKLQKTKTRRKLFRRRRQEMFLEHLAATCNVTASAAAAGVVVGTVYHARMRDPAFREAWGRALEQGYARLEAMLIERAAAGGPPIAVRGDKEVADAPWDRDLALQLLREHKRGLAGIPKAGAPASRASLDEVRAAVVKKLRALGYRAED